MQNERKVEILRKESKRKKQTKYRKRAGKRESGTCDVRMATQDKKRE